jgi:hypothetical protein
VAEESCEVSPISVGPVLAPGMVLPLAGAHFNILISHFILSPAKKGGIFCANVVEVVPHHAGNA